MSDDVQYTVPILFLVFNQPEITSKVFDEIKKIRPKKLFVSADGPRSQRVGEDVECLEVRSLLNGIDWDCELHVRFLDTNLGCKEAVSTAITWFFEHTEEGVILEYDCLPNNHFFEFCKQMLERYRDDTRVMCISGNNFQDGIVRGDGDYYYSRLATIWGWATWRRAWKYWEGSLGAFPEFTKQKILYNVLSDAKSVNHWHRKFNDVYTGINNSTWGFPWVYAVISQGGLCVTPNVNLVSNIGFTASATHATSKNDPCAFLPTKSLTGIKPPSFIVPNLAADIYFSRKLTKIPFALKVRLFLSANVRPFLPNLVVQMIKQCINK